MLTARENRNPKLLQRIGARRALSSHQLTRFYQSYPVSDSIALSPNGVSWLTDKEMTLSLSVTN